MKKILSIVMAVIMLFSLGVSAHADSFEIVEPRGVEIAKVNMVLNFVGTAGDAHVFITGHTGTTYISATLTVHVLQGTRWVYVGSDSDSLDGSYLSLYVSFSGVPGSYYRSMLELTVIRNGVTETETEFKYAWC